MGNDSTWNSAALPVEVRIFHGTARGDVLRFCPDEISVSQKVQKQSKSRRASIAGSSSSSTPTRLSKMVIVITTYQTMEHEYRRIVNTHKTKCQYCGKMMLPEKMPVHLQYICGPDAVLTEKQRKTERKDEV